MKKRILSILLILCMVLMLCPMTALAEEPTGSLAITVDGFQVGKTPTDIKYSFASTIPGVTFSETDILRDAWMGYIFDGNDYSWLPIGPTEAFQADTPYRLTISLNNKGLELAPAATVNGIEPLLCWLPTFGDVPYAIQIGCELGTPPKRSQYTITYAGGEYGTGSIPAGTKTRGEDFTLSSDTFTRQGYVQCGWRTSDNLTDYSLGGIYSMDADVTLYPVWDEIGTATVPFTTTVTLGGSAAPGETVFELELVDASGKPLSNDAVTVSASVTTNGAGSYNGVLTLDGPQNQIIDLLQYNQGGTFVRQVDAGAADWTLDGRVWGLTLDNNPESETFLSLQSLQIYPVTVSNGKYYSDENASPVKQMLFTNTYTKSTYKPSENGTNTVTVTSPQTGDNSNLAVWFALLAVSAAGVMGAGVYSKRRRSSR